MVSWSKVERKAGGFIKELDTDDLYDQLDNMRTYLTSCPRVPLLPTIRLRR